MNVILCVCICILTEGPFSEFACVSIGALPAPSSACVCETACHSETSESEACCACVTRRLVATGGGKQADLYSFDQPGGTGRAEGCQQKG